MTDSSTLAGEDAARQQRGSSTIRTAFVSTYVPRQCGIATFCEDLYKAVRVNSAPGVEPQVVAINGPGPERYKYPGEVAFEMHRDKLDDYQRAADFINFSDADVVCVQHEFGIFGGEGGMHLARLLRGLRKPVVTTLHTVLSNPEPHYRRGLISVANWSNVLVTMTQHSRKVLIETYGLDPARVEVIPHGAPVEPQGDQQELKDRLNLGDRHILLTFGLLGPGKGIESAIEAVAIAAKKHPDITYLIVGSTHPEVKRLYGEDYRLMLQRRVEELGIKDNVVFYNQYLSKQELVEFLKLCDIYLIPYPNLDQTVSGTLSYALAMRNAVVSTPFLHAKEVLADDRGILVEPGKPEQMGQALLDLLNHPDRIAHYKARSELFGEQTNWPAIGKVYADLFERVQTVYAETVRVERASQPMGTQQTVVEPMFDHMRRLTDDTGILQHAICRTPNRHHGYCTDDNARALQVAVINQDRLDEQGFGHLTSRYLSFLHYAQREDGRFHNFMSYQRHWLDDVGSEDCQGRAIWALGGAILLLRDPLDRLLAKQVFDRALTSAARVSPARARAYTMLGLGNYLERYTDNSPVRRLLAEHANALAEMYQRHRSDDWEWFEELMTYANAKLPEAMLVAGAALENVELITIGRKTLDFLTAQVLEGDHFSLIGNEGWLARGRTKAPFAQQPIDAAALVAAYRTAALILEEDSYLDLARKSLDWFLGSNDLRIALYDFGNGGCCDGLGATGVNINQGAESTLVCLKAISIMADPMNPRLI